jgi:xanthine dehydrogenase YagR molybdenum-binding subunit
MVVADTFERAREGAPRLRIAYDQEPAVTSFESAGAGDGSPRQLPGAGDAEAAFAAAPITVDNRYSTPANHHNPMELFTTTCAWDGDRLTVWESSQNVHGCRIGLAEQLGLDPARVRFLSPQAGGAFGVSGGLSQRTALVALAARMISRPVRLEATRSQGFTITSFRSETRQRVRLAAGRDGRLQALIHDGLDLTSRADVYATGAVAIGMTMRFYACPNVAGSAGVVAADRGTPGSMRAPQELPYMFGLESAMDELAHALGIDPIELRRRNDTTTEPVNGLPYTSRSLMRCFDAAAEVFGWSRRTPEPGSMRDGDWLIGMGCAAATLPTFLAPATARVTLLPEDTARVQTATHEIGQGILTAVALTAARELGLPMTAVLVEIGDSDLPPAAAAGGSSSTASVCNAVAAACRDVMQRRGPPGEPRNRPIEALGEFVPYGAPDDAIHRLHAGIPVYVGGAFLNDRVQTAFGANFAEVRVHRLTREIRVPRLVGAYAAGRIVNPLTARSQLVGGQIWGMSSGLHEATELDERAARYTNADLAGYLIPVNADVGEVTSILVEEEDKQVNALGIKGLGELGNVGTNAAIANAVFHATGIRVRELPIRLEDLL